MLFHLSFLYLTCSCLFSYNLILTATYLCRPYKEFVIEKNIYKQKVKKGGGNSVPRAAVIVDCAFFSICLTNLVHENFTPWR
jgi:hypothetical protein